MDPHTYGDLWHEFLTKTIGDYFSNGYEFIGAKVYFADSVKLTEEGTINIDFLIAKTDDKSKEVNFVSKDVSFKDFVNSFTDIVFQFTDKLSFERDELNWDTIKEIRE